MKTIMTYTGNKALALVLVAALMTALIPMTPTRDGYDTIVGRNITPINQKTPAVDIADIILDWRAYFDKAVTVTGVLICRNEDECSFIANHRLRRVVGLDVVLLPTNTKRQIVLGCHDQACTVTLNGRVLDDGIMVLSILSVTTRQMLPT